MKSIAVIGAGIAGLTLAAGLRDRASVVVFEKSRGLGGRMATRRAEPYAFDHGAQYFRARTPEFRAFLEQYLERDVVQSWHARYVELDRNKELSRDEWSDLDPCYVASPGMNALAKALAETLDVRLGTRVTRVDGYAERWRLHDQNEDELGEFDWVISATPAPQAAEIMPAAFAHSGALHRARLSGCFTLMLGFGQPLELTWDAARIHDADVSWIAVNSSKPGRRREHFSLVAQSSNDWADAHIEDAPETVTQHLLSEVSEITGEDAGCAEHRALHRWRYANVSDEAGDLTLVDDRNRLAACGDWCNEGRVEAAYLSAKGVLSRLS